MISFVFVFFVFLKIPYFKSAIVANFFHPCLDFYVWATTAALKTHGPMTRHS